MRATVMVNNFGPPKTKIKFAESKSPAIVTFVLIFLCLIMFFMSSSTKVEPWLVTNTFQPIKAITLLRDRDFANLATMLGYCNFASLNIWQLLISIYFLCVFGITIEKALGAGRFFILVILGCTIPWAVLAWDVTSTTFTILPWENIYRGSFNFFGPTLLIFTFLGAYVVLAPEKKVDLSQNRPRPRNEIFNHSQAKPMNERFGLSPWTFMSAFVVLAIGFHFALTMLWKTEFGSSTLYSSLISIIIGYTLASMFLASAMETVQDSPLKQKALKHYYELRSLDIGSADAIKGTSQALGLPMEQVKTWVASNKGKMRISTEK